MATIIAAITKAAVTTNMMRFISTTLPVEGRGKKRCEDPRPCLLAPSVSGRRGHRRIPPIAYLWGC
jgi:hypothetical protein